MVWNLGKVVSSALILQLLCGTLPLYGKEPVSPFNGQALPKFKKIQSYSFLLAGHIYGMQNRSPLPAASMLQAIPKLNAARPAFMILLGDIMQRPRPEEGRLLKDQLLGKLAFPVFNAPGNHEMYNRDYYEKHFGPNTYQSFRLQSEHFILMDGEIEDGNLGQKQILWILDEIGKAKKDPSVKNIFILMHRLLWAINNPPYDQLIPFVNGPDFHKPKSNAFTSRILPALRAIKNKAVYIASGDVGMEDSMSLYFQKDPNNNITYIATGIGDTPHDAVLQVNSSKGQLTFTRLPLLDGPQGRSLAPPQNCNLAYWKDHFEKHPRYENANTALPHWKRVLERKRYWAALPLWKRVLVRKKFWLGLLAGLALGGLGGQMLFARRKTRV